MRRRTKPAKTKVTATPSGAAPTREGGRVRDLEKRLAEALRDKAEALGKLQTRDRELAEAQDQLTAAHAQVRESHEQQTATSEILRVISSSPTELQPVLDALVKSAARFCAADDALIHRLEGDGLQIVAAHHGPIPTPAGFVTPVHGTASGRSVLERRAVHVADIAAEAEMFPEESAIARALGFRTMLSVPLLREGVPLGTIVLRRSAVEPFSEKQIALLQTFADQAVIAIENVRLFTELQEKNGALTRAHAQVSEALEQQTAASEILRVIASSPTDVQRVFDTIAEHAWRLCDATVSGVLRFDGELVHVIALGNIGFDSPIVRQFPMPPSNQSAPARAVLTRQMVHIPDVLEDPEYPVGPQAAASGFRSALAVPMLREGQVIGSIVVGRSRPGPYSTAHMELLKTFADQAVIAIENVRLFTELQASNRELTSALDTQTATSDILRVISQSQIDVQPVFDAIVESAVRLLHAYYGAMTRVVGDRLERVATTSTTGTEDPGVRAAWAVPLDGESMHAKAIHDGAPVNIADALTEPGVSDRLRAVARGLGYRSLVVVPLLRHDEAIGTIAVTRREPGGFTDDEIALLKTFADQAVIAIENARLLTELQTRTADLTRSVGELTALGEVSQAVSSTLDLQTVLTTIVARATLLAGADAGIIYEYDREREIFRPRATERLEPEIVEVLETAPVRKGEGATGQLAVLREPVQLSDIHTDYLPSLHHARDAFVRAGYRALLAVPLLREGDLIGGLTVMRKIPGEF